MKKNIKVEVGTLDVSYASATEIIKQLSTYINEYGAENVTTQQATERYTDNTYTGIFISREETDEEYSKRIIQENVWKLQKEESERRTFEYLQQKFGV